MKFRGKVWKFGDNVDTDAIIAARYLVSSDPAFLAAHCMEDADPDFMKKISAGDIIVAGENFGCGSSREHAVWAIRGAGVATVIARTFARIFYRNAIDCGFYLIESKDAIERIADGDEVQIDYDKGIIEDKTNGQRIEFRPLPDFALEIIKDGGLLEHIKKRKS